MTTQMKALDEYILMAVFSHKPPNNIRVGGWVGRGAVEEACNQRLGFFFIKKNNDSFIIIIFLECFTPLSLTLRFSWSKVLLFSLSSACSLFRWPP